MRLWAGIPLSAIGHAAAIALALWALPWFRVRPRPPDPAMAVSLISPAELASLALRASPPPAPEPVATPVVRPPPPTPTPPAPELPALEPEDAGDLAPAFDSEAPLGIGVPTPPPFAEAFPAGIPLVEPAPPEPAPPPQRPQELAEPDEQAQGTADDVAGVAETAAAAALRATYEAAVRAAITRARYYPPIAQERRISGTTEISVTVSRSGRLVSVRVSESSGSELLDRAAVGASSLAQLPVPPADLPDATPTVTVRLTYDLSGPRAAPNSGLSSP